MRLTDEQIGAELRALRPTPDESFAAVLDRRAAGGFPSAKPDAGGRELAWGRLLPVLGALAAAAVVVVVVASSGNGGSGTNPGGELAAPRQAPSTAAPSAGVGAAGGAQSLVKPATPETIVPPSEPPVGGRPHNGRPQVQEQSASLALSTDPSKLQDAADGVVQVAHRYDGFVDSSSVHAGGSRGHASFALRVPTAHLNDAIADLSDLGHVTSSDLGTTNVTGTYVGASRAYAQARAKVNSLLDQLRTASGSDADAIRARLAVARDQLAAARAALRGLKQRVALTPVSVEISAQGDGSGWSIGDAADDAVNVLEAIGGALLIALAVLVPLAALLTLGWLGAREFSRRRREATLDH
jgi:hypothetical protein